MYYRYCTVYNFLEATTLYLKICRLLSSRSVIYYSVSSRQRNSVYDLRATDFNICNCECVKKNPVKYYFQLNYHCTLSKLINSYENQTLRRMYISDGRKWHGWENDSVCILRTCKKSFCLNLCCLKALN